MRRMGILLATVVLLFAYRMASAEANASVSGGCNHPSGEYCVGDTISIVMLISGSARASSEGYSDLVQIDVTRYGNYSDGLLGGALLSGDSWAQGGGVALQMSSAAAFSYGSSKDLTIDDVGIYTGSFVIDLNAFATDGINTSIADYYDEQVYNYTVNECWAFPPNLRFSVPNVLAPSEKSE